MYKPLLKLQISAFKIFIIYNYHTIGCRDAKPVDIKHLTASGSLSLYPPQHGDMMKASGGWCADVNTSSTSFLQLDFGKNTFICSLITTGSSSREAWVTKYTLKYSLDGIYWMSVKDMNGVDKVSILDFLID